MSAQATTETPEYIQYEVTEGVATIWLNRPEVKNFVNWALLTQMGEAVNRAKANDSVRVVLFRGRGRNVYAGEPQHAGR